MNDLSFALQRLPRELCDQIFNDVFTSDSTTVRIDRSHKLPTELRVSCATRELFAGSYYGSPNKHFISDNDWLLIYWLRSLPECHFQLLKDVRLVNRSLLDEGIARYIGPGRRFNCSRKDFAVTNGVNLKKRLKMKLLGLHEVHFWEKIFRVEQHFKNENGEEEVVLC